MEGNTKNIDQLLIEISDLKGQLLEATSIIEAIKDGSVDALVLTKDGQPQIYSIESADYTYRILIEKFGEGALSISDEGLILYSNNYFSKMSGLPANQITGSYLFSYVDKPEELKKLIIKSLKENVKAEINLNFNGKIIPTYISLTDLSPTVSAIGVVITDLTEKKKNEEALLSYQHRLETKINELNVTNTNLGQFIHVISHDLKEPLRKVLMYTTHLYEAKSGIFDQKELNNLSIINSSAHRLDSLVDDLVKYAFSSTKNPLKKVDLNKVMEEVLDDLEFVIGESSAKISYDRLPVIDGSKVQLRQLFSNLLSNAIKYRKNGVPPVISITTKSANGIDQQDADRDFHVISMEDNGIGMDEKYISRIFTIFQRLHSRNEYSGNGIGLAISKKIMENHNGKIIAESVLGTGSTFLLYFPVLKNSSTKSMPG